MYCKYCGHKSDDKENFCSSCGKPIEKLGKVIGVQPQGNKGEAERPIPFNSRRNVMEGSAGNPLNRNRDDQKGVVSKLSLAIALLVILILGIFGVGLWEEYGNTKEDAKRSEINANSTPAQPKAIEVAESYKYNIEEGGESLKPSLNLTDEERQNILLLIKVWDECHAYEYYFNMGELYAKKVSYYGENYSRDDVVMHKENFMSENEEYQQKSHGFTMQLLDNGDVMVEFTKSVRMNGFSRDYPSYLIVKRSSNSYGWSILKESDKITDRNLRK